MSKKSTSRKRKIKILWLDEWHIEEQEAWFTDMAKQGWILEELGLWIATFVQADPQELSFRIEIAKKNKGIEDDRIQLYDDAGWRYVTSRRFIHVFREKEPNEAIEIHTDPTLQAETVEVLKKSVLNNGIAVILLSLFVVFLLLFVNYNLSSYDLLRNQFVSDGIVFLVYLYIVFNWGSGMVHITSLIKRLRKGIGFKHNHRFKQKIRRNKMIGAVIGMLLFMMIGIVIFDRPILNTESMYPEIPAAELPVISLTDIEDVDLKQVTYETNGIERKRENHYLEHSSILVPKQFILHQQFIIPEKSWNNYGDKYNPTIHSKKYETLTISIAKKLVDILLEEYYTTESFSELDITGYDEAWIMVNSPSNTIIAREGKNVYDIYYYGNESIKKLDESLISHMDEK